MLARSAQGLYWMGRYLERAEHLCRLLRLQTGALVDRPPREICFGWSRIYGSLNRQPPGDTLEVGDDFFTLADSYTLADDLTFERSNPDSVWSCFALGRENARQMRHCISAEMWTRLNLAYLRIQKLSIQDIWGTPESFYDETVAEIATFAGVAAATMYRDQGWSFLQLGRFIERAQLSTSLLLTQIEADSTTAEESEADWTSLLRAYHAFEAYDRSYSVEVRPRQVLDLLATDPMLPDSLVPLPRHGVRGARCARSRSGRGRQRRRRATLRTQDVAPTRGVLLGGGDSTLEVDVRMRLVDPAPGDGGNYAPAQSIC